MGKPTEDLWAWLKFQLSDKGALAIAVAAFVLLGTSWDAHAVARRVEAVEKKQDRYEEDLHEFAKDLRELYRVMPRIQDSERLERPFPVHDGGVE